MLHRTIIATTVALMLTGCAGSASTAPPRTEAPKPPTMSQAEDACGARQVQDHVGEAYTEALGERLEQESGAGDVRAKRPGQAYTMEFRADRLDVNLDDAGVIRAIRCG
ncbi:I78 family peptidase inhibitor [Halomonas caseinilytica]|uniref:I78 family peptidase inhibitor n=1 Tax=Halomonas caseinilytica TaxID=438744 RepID=UPI0007E5400A|nr:I78 family peptidase inhibitor [Halomonas caseinilytica]SEN31208.1 Peptidase inhibitor I78 family protein [Halomonas caseinilytica]